MTDWYFLWELLAAGAESFVILSAAARLAGRKYVGRSHRVCLLTGTLLGAALSGLISWQYAYHIAPLHWLSAGVPFLFTVLFSGLLSREKPAVRAGVTAAVTLAVYLLCAMSFCFAALIIHDDAFAFNPFAALLHTGAARNLYLVISTAAIFGMWGSLPLLFQNRPVRLSALPGVILAELLLGGVCYGLMAYAYRRLWLVSNMAAGIFISFLLLLFFLLFSTYRREKRTNELLHTTNSMMAENYQRLYEDQQLRARQLHDFNHHLKALRSLSAQGKGEEAAEYVDSLLSASYREMDLSHSGNNVVDAIINCKAAEARAEHIDFCYTIETAVPSAIDPADLCAVLANQLDNAIDACKLIPDQQERKIEVHIWQQTEKLFFFQVVNTVSGDPFRADGRLVSTKRDTTRPHGLGIRSIRDTAEKYQGTLKNAYENGRFISTVFLCDTKKES